MTRVSPAPNIVPRRNACASLPQQARSATRLVRLPGLFERPPLMPPTLQAAAAYVRHRSAARGLKGDEHGALRHHIPLAPKRPLDDGVGGGAQGVLHLHRLEHEQRLSRLDRLARLH